MTPLRMSHAEGYLCATRLFQAGLRVSVDLSPSHKKVPAQVAVIDSEFTVDSLVKIRDKIIECGYGSEWDGGSYFYITSEYKLRVDKVK